VLLFLISKAVQNKETISDLVEQKQPQNETLKKPSSLQPYLENAVAAFGPSGWKAKKLRKITQPFSNKKN